MREEDVEISIKVLVVGNGSVGKSTMIQRYCKGVFVKEYKKTIGVDFLEKCINFEDEEVRLMIWDTAGQEEFDAITKAYYRGAQACVLAFSTVDHASYAEVPKWRNQVLKECGDIPMVLVQNKIDLIDSATVTKDEAEGLSKRLKLRLYRTSVKEDFNVSTVFEYLAKCYIGSLNEQDMTEEVQTQIAPAPSKSSTGSGKKKKKSQNNGIVLDGSKKQEKKKKQCFNV